MRATRPRLTRLLRLTSRPLTPVYLGSTGNVNIRGKLITGVIKTTKMKNTVIIRKDYLHYIPKYNRFEKRHKNTPVHVSVYRLRM